jgi:hypothetical protein
MVGGGVLAVLGLGFLEESEVPGVLVVESACHSAARLQPVLLELPHAGLLLPGRAGGLPCPWNRGTVDAVACRETTRASDRANEVGPPGSGCRAGSAQVPGWSAAFAAGVGHARNRPARSLHPGRGGRTRLPPRGPLAGPGYCDATCAIPLPRGVMCARSQGKPADAASAARQLRRASEPLTSLADAPRGG